MAGSRRARTQRVLDHLGAQRPEPPLEVIVADLRPDLAPFGAPDGLALRVLPAPGRRFGAARALAATAARGEVVAFLEDHCYPAPGWLVALREAFLGPWAALGYAFDNDNPRTLTSRVSYAATYAEWAAPARGPAASLPGNNVAYRRSALLALGEELPVLLQADFNLHGRLRETGQALGIEPGARVAHEHEESPGALLRGAFSYSHALAAVRARREGLGRGARAGRAARILVAGPLLRFAGAAAGARRRPGALAALAALSPGVLAVFLASALGESRGYLLGAGRAEARATYWEVDAPRAR